MRTLCQSSPRPLVPSKEPTPALHPCSIPSRPTHPHNVARDAFIERDGLSSLRLHRFSRSVPTAGSVPALGADADELLAELGYDDAAVTALRESGAI